MLSSSLLNPIYKLRSKLFWGDTVVVSFPKSGRTWLRVMLDYGKYFTQYTHAGSEHRAAHHMEELSFDENEYAHKRVVFLIRDPLDTAVSGFFQASARLGKYDDNIHAFIRDPHYGIEKIIKFNLLWMENLANVKDAIVIEYEAMHRDCTAEMVRIIEFITQSKPSPELTSNIVGFGAFKNMRAIEKQGGFKGQYGKILSPKDVSDENTYKTRKGKVGGYKEHLSDDDIAYGFDLLEKYNYWSHVRSMRKTDMSDAA